MSTLTQNQLQEIHEVFRELCLQNHISEEVYRQVSVITQNYHQGVLATPPALTNEINDDDDDDNDEDNDDLVFEPPSSCAQCRVYRTMITGMTTLFVDDRRRVARILERIRSTIPSHAEF